MKTFVTLLLACLFVSISYHSFSSNSANIQDLGTQKEQIQQLKDKLGAKRYERLMRKIDRKQAKKGGTSPSTQAIIALAVSILGIFFFPLAIVGVILGANAKKRMRESENFENKGVATAAIVIGGIIIGIIALALGYAFYLFFYLER